MTINLNSARTRTRWRADDLFHKWLEKKISDRKKSLSSLKVSAIELMSYKGSFCLFGIRQKSTSMGGSVADECHIFLNFSLRDTIVDLMPKQSKNLCISPLEDFKIIFIPISSPSLIFFLRGGGICAESLTEKIIYT